MQEPPEKPKARELAEQAIIAGAGMIPIAGSPIAVAFAVAMGWSYNKRMRAWLEDLAAAVNELQDAQGEAFSIEDLADNDLFTDAIVNATRAAQATHHEEKLRALRNGVLHSIGPDAPSVDEQARFFRLVEDFTPAHLRLLSFVNDPGVAFEASGIPKPDLLAGPTFALVERGMPEFERERDWYNLLAGDLSGARLTNRELTGMMSEAGLWQPYTSPLGRRFLAFIKGDDPTVI